MSRDKTWAQLVDKAVTAYIEPRLIEPTILYDYPIELSPFARVTDADPGSSSGSSTTSAAWSSGTLSAS